MLLQSPYIITEASGSAEGASVCEVSTDGGKTWSAAELKDFTGAVKGQLRALVRFTIKDELKNLKLQATVQNNPFALPFLAPGKNTITVSVADPAALGDNKLVVTYAYRPGERRKSYEQLCIEGKEIARGHDASWSTTPVVVQKTFTARDLPATFDINVPTPKDKYPVYPRMVFVRREVLAPNQKPLPLPEDAREPKLVPGDELKTLPNPLLVGTQAPPAKAVRPVKTLTLDLKVQGFVTKSGRPVEAETLQWPKNNQEKVESAALLISNELKNLPALKDLAAVRLVFPGIRSHNKAPTQIGVTALRAPLVPDQAFDFNKLGDVVGTTTVPLLEADAPSWLPPKQFKVDVTRAIRSVMIGDAKFHGFGLRVVPDRGIDDGWSVRLQLPKDPKVILEIDVYNHASVKEPK